MRRTIDKEILDCLSDVMKLFSSKTVDQVSELLSHFLSDTFVLYVKTLNFHWNMVGKEFYMYHRLLQEQYEELQKAIDEIAEHIRMLGRRAPGSMKAFLKLASLKESERKLTEVKMIQELLADQEYLIKCCHKIILFTDEVHDEASSDLLVDRIREHQKQAWLLRSHLT